MEKKVFMPSIIVDKTTNLYGISYMGIDVVKPYYDYIFTEGILPYITMEEVNKLQEHIRNTYKKWTITKNTGIYFTIKSGKYGLLNSYFKEVIPNQYEYIHIIGKHLAIRLNNKYAIFNLNSMNLTQFKYDYIEYIFYNVFYVEIDGLCGLVNQFGNEIIPIRFTKETLFESVLNKQIIKNILNIN